MHALRSLLRSHGFAVSAVVLVLVGAFMVFAALRFGADSRWVEHTHRVIRAVDAVRDAQDRSGIEWRNYLLTRDANAFVEHRVIEAELGRHVVALRQLVADNREQVERVATLQRLLAQRRSTIQAGLSATSPQGARIVTELGAVRAATESLYEQLIGTENGLLAARAARSERTLSLLLGAALLAIPFSLLMLRYGNSMLATENAARAHSEREMQRSVDSLQQLSAELEGLTTFASLLQGATSMDELFAVTAKTFPKLLRDVGGRMYLIKASRDYAEIAAEWGESTVASDPVPSPDSCWAVRRQRPHVVNEAASGLICAHCQPPDDPQASVACLPLGGQGESYGWITFSGAAAFSSGDLRLASSACEQLSLALGNARLRDALRHQSVRDPLTGLYNRRYLEEGLVRELARCTRRQLPLSVMMLDLDHFKAFNDAYGHAGGDLVLATFGKLLEGLCRTEDIPCRFGGEEFALVLPEASAQVALLRANQIRAALASQVIMHMGRELGRVTVSIGIAAWPANGRSGTELLQVADAALYRAKHAGRDRAELA